MAISWQLIGASQGMSMTAAEMRGLDDEKGQRRRKDMDEK
jgi:hypothetical protein